MQRRPRLLRHRISGRGVAADGVFVCLEGQVTVSQAAREGVPNDGGDSAVSPEIDEQYTSLLVDGLFGSADEATLDDEPPEDSEDNEQGDDEEDWNDDEEDSAGETSEAEPGEGEGDEEAPEPDAAEPQGRNVDDWAQILRDNPRRLAEVPGKVRAEAVERALQLAVETTGSQLVEQLKPQVEKVRQTAYQQGMAYARQLIDQVDEYNELASMQEDDPENFLSLMRSSRQEDRAKVRRFFEWQDKGGPEKVLPSIPEQVDPIQVANNAFVVASGPARQLLQQNEQLRKVILQKQEAEPGRYAVTPQGITNLQSDILQALLSGQVKEPAASKQASRSPAAQARQQAARERQGGVRPSSGGGSAAVREAVPGSGTYTDYLTAGLLADLERPRKR